MAAATARSRSLAARVARATTSRRALARWVAGRAVRLDTTSVLAGRVVLRLVVGGRVLPLARVAVGPAAAPRARLRPTRAVRVALSRAEPGGVVVRVRSRLTGAGPVVVERRAP